MATNHSRTLPPLLGTSTVDTERLGTTAMAVPSHDAPTPSRHDAAGMAGGTANVGANGLDGGRAGGEAGGAAQKPQGSGKDEQAREHTNGHDQADADTAGAVTDVVEISIFEKPGAEGPLTKVGQLGPDGKLEMDPSYCWMSSGRRGYWQSTSPQRRRTRQIGRCGMASRWNGRGRSGREYWRRCSRS